MNETIKTQLSHRSIRKFKNEKVSEDVIKTLLDVTNQTASSVAMQTYSVIRITDENKKKEIAEVCMQPYVVGVPELWIFVADLFRNANILAELDSYPDERNDMDKFFQAYTDAALAAQNLMLGVESLGMGGVFFGGILNDPDRMIQILNLPEYTFPVLGVGFGHPDENPELKPRMNIELKVFENEYKTQDNYLEALKGYDDVLSEYYQSRSSNLKIESFTQHVLNNITRSTEKRKKVINSIIRQGFSLNLEYVPEGDIRQMFKKLPEHVEEYVFEESKLGFRVDTSVKSLFDEYPFVKDYLLIINPKFNKLRTLVGTKELLEMTISNLADIGEMPVDSLIYMIESRISEE